ncbi:response regulator [Flavobacterium sp. ZT3P35]|uniref:hybrid sensor histidine kinase/response regulator n=1 Tax=Flavobacterium sp. ZT3P35 TaxID=3401727 RepID=UPI003AAD838E
MKINSPVKILIVDDLPENLFALEVILSNENYLCVRANSGNEALKILIHQQDFAIILIDVQMPLMDGFETVDLIRQIDKLKHVPIIFLTASNDNSLQIFKGYEAGAVDYMIKPLSPEILKAKVAIFVDLHLKTQELLVQAEQLKKLNTDLIQEKLLSEYTISLIEASHDPLFAVSPEGKITDVNNASVQITGISRIKLIGTDFFDYFTNSQKGREVYQTAFEKGFVTDCPLILKQKKGDLIDVLFNGSVYKNDAKKVLGVVLVARDVTDQKHIANELIEAKISAESARGHAEQAKIRAEKATRVAEGAMQAKQQFLSNMSHEIRTPMNAIIGFTKVIMRTDLTAKQNEYLNAIKLSGDALIVLIDDILDLAKVDSGKMTFEKIPFKIKSTVSVMLQLFEPKILEKNLQLIKEYDNKIPDFIIGDPVRLHQIILNLVSNAVKFTSKGKVTVSVDLFQQDEHNVVLKFSIKDTGIGISEDKIGSIFENFQQATSGTSRLYAGTGLGLAIVKQLLEAQGGSICVESTLHVGSTFSFMLSFKKTNAVAELENEIMELDSQMKNVKILVVEDITLNQMLMKTILDDFGFDCEIAENGKIAVEKLKEKEFDVVLMDLQMPVMNGFEATEYIRNTMKSSIPIIALTADVTTVDLEKCKLAGMDDYLVKPVDEKLLHSKIVSFLSKPKNIEVIDAVVENENSIEEIRYVDLTYLNRRTKSNPELMMEMISIYLEQTPHLLNTIKQSLKEENWTLLGAAVHKMLPSFTIMGIHPDHENVAKKIHDFTITKDKNNTIFSLVTQLDKICKQACSELQEEFNTLKNSLK